jgi:hypothetical protein
MSASSQRDWQAGQYALVRASIIAVKALGNAAVI